MAAEDLYKLTSLGPSSPGFRVGASNLLDMVGGIREVAEPFHSRRKGSAGRAHDSITKYVHDRFVDFALAQARAAVASFAR